MLPEVVVPVRAPDGWTLETAGGSFPSNYSYGTFGFDFIDRSSSRRPLPAVYVCTSMLPEPDACATGDDAVERKQVSTGTGELDYIVGSPQDVAEWTDVEWTTIARSVPG